MFITLQPPEGEDRTGNDQHRRDKVAGNLVGQQRRARFFLLGTIHQTHDGRQLRFGASGGNLHQQRTLDVKRTADQAITGFFADGQVFASECGFIDRAAAFHHHAVSRNRMAGFETQHVTNTDIFTGDDVLDTVVTNFQRDVGQQRQQIITGFTHPVTGAHFQKAAE